jgi:hypothetical protein
MNQFSAFAQSSPIIVCGNPRSGTRMHANVLNVHPDILITDEFHDLAYVRRFLSEFRRGKLLKKFSRTKALERQAALAKFIWLVHSVDRIANEGITAKYVGNKTPQLERHYKVLENIFYSCPPKYIYCLRSASKVLRSVKNLSNLRWSKDSVATNLSRYLRSVRRMEEMKIACPDRVYVSVIDHLVPGMPNSVFFANAFGFIGVDLTVDVRREIDQMKSQNTMEAVKAVTKQTSNIIELSDEEANLIENSEEYRDVAVKYSLGL